MSPWISKGPNAQRGIGPLTMMHHGEAISLASDVGALSVLHGALQSAIAKPDDASDAENAYQLALDALSSDS